MKLFAKKAPHEETRTPERIARISRADTPTLLSWFDNTIMGLGSSFDRWRYHGDPIEEVVQHVDALAALMDEIKERQKD